MESSTEVQRSHQHALHHSTKEGKNKMTFTVKSEEKGRYSVSIEMDKYSDSYKVRAYENRGGQWYRIADLTKADRAKAETAFNRYAKKYL